LIWSKGRRGWGERPFGTDVVLLDDYCGTVGVIGDRGAEYYRLTARLEGILLDPIYTGRAMGGLIDLVRRNRLGPADSVLFWHTGGSPALFA
jgi:D-cysteine desulfhydrase